MTDRVPSPSQRAAIEAEPGPRLVLAGPGAGKTFCLTERIAVLIERHGIAPERICAFTFTNKAAREIAHRLASRLPDAVQRLTIGTIHAFCSALLREHGAAVGLDPGFGIADEEYQLAVLRRIEGHRHWHRTCLTRFSAFRFRGDPLRDDDALLFQRYVDYLARRSVVDFDTLILKAAELLERLDEAAPIRGRWDAILVDEFQDLNPVQYRIVRALAHEHRHVFAVGDHEQSIFAFAGADKSVFRKFANDFGLDTRVRLEDNRRCPRTVFAHARTLVESNEPLFGEVLAATATRESPFPVRAVGFEDEDAEAAWIIDDLRRDREQHGHAWGDIALLYRTHDIGERLEGALINAGVPCRMAKGRALGDDPVVGYVLAAARVIADPDDDLLREAFFRVMLPRTVYQDARAQAEAGRRTLRQQMDRMAARLPRHDTAARAIKRALYHWENLASLARQRSLAALVQELLSRRVGALRSALEDRHDEITDPEDLPDVVALADCLRTVRDRRQPLWIPPLGGADIPIAGMLNAVGIRAVRGSAPPPDAARLDPAATPSCGTALGVFKAAQLLEMAGAATHYTDFTAVDLETTDRDIETAEIIDIAAVRVRDGRIVDRFSSYVRPRVPIAAGATAVHGITDATLAGERYFEEVWPQFRAFCGDDIVVAHNGYEFDFPILRRMVQGMGAAFDLSTYDTLPLARDLFPTSRKLGDLARQFGVELAHAHRALDDSLALAEVFVHLDAEKLRRARKTALVSLLDQLGVALALSSGEGEGDPVERALFRTLARPYALGRYSHCLEWYEHQRGVDDTLPSVETVIDRLGGRTLMDKIRADKTADDRYPAAMARLRRLIAEIPDGPLGAQLATFLERAVLSKWDGQEAERDRVNLFTLHSTKGLEFSRVYIVGAEDGQLPGGSMTRESTAEEIEEARRLLYVGMTRTIDRLVLTRAATRGGKPTGGHRFLDDMDLPLEAP